MAPFNNNSDPTTTTAKTTTDPNKKRFPNQPSDKSPSCRVRPPKRMPNQQQYANNMSTLMAAQPHQQYQQPQQQQHQQQQPQQQQHQQQRQLYQQPHLQQQVSNMATAWPCTVTSAQSSSENKLRPLHATPVVAKQHPNNNYPESQDRYCHERLPSLQRGVKSTDSVSVVVDRRQQQQQTVNSCQSGEQRRSRSNTWGSKRVVLGNRNNNKNSSSSNSIVDQSPNIDSPPPTCARIVASSTLATEEWHTQFYKTKLCPYNVEGACTNGSTCRFAHNHTEVRPLPDLQRTKLCESYVRKERCADDNCPFAHDPSQLRTSSHSFYKVTLCNFYKKGRCWNGAHCRFAHGVAELQIALSSPLASLPVPQNCMVTRDAHLLKPNHFGPNEVEQQQHRIQFNGHAVPSRSSISSKSSVTTGCSNMTPAAMHDSHDIHSQQISNDFTSCNNNPMNPRPFNQPQSLADVNIDHHSRVRSYTDFHVNQIANEAEQQPVAVQYYNFPSHEQNHQSVQRTRDHIELHNAYNSNSAAPRSTPECNAFFHHPGNQIQNRTPTTEQRQSMPRYPYHANDPTTKDTPPNYPISTSPLLLKDAIIDVASSVSSTDSVSSSFVMLHQLTASPSFSSMKSPTDSQNSKSTPIMQYSDHYPPILKCNALHPDREDCSTSDSYRDNDNNLFPPFNQFDAASLESALAALLQESPSSTDFGSSPSPASTSSVPNHQMDSMIVSPCDSLNRRSLGLAAEDEAIFNMIKALNRRSADEAFDETTSRPQSIDEQQRSVRAGISPVNSYDTFSTSPSSPSSMYYNIRSAADIVSAPLALSPKSFSPRPEVGNASGCFHNLFGMQARQESQEGIFDVEKGDWSLESLNSNTADSMLPSFSSFVISSLLQPCALDQRDEHATPQGSTARSDSGCLSARGELRQLVTESSSVNYRQPQMLSLDKIGSFVSDASANDEDMCASTGATTTAVHTPRRSLDVNEGAGTSFTRTTMTQELTHTSPYSMRHHDSWGEISGDGLGASFNKQTISETIGPGSVSATCLAAQSEYQYLAQQQCHDNYALSLPSPKICDRVSHPAVLLGTAPPARQSFGANVFSGVDHVDESTPANTSPNERHWTPAAAINTRRLYAAQVANKLTASDVHNRQQMEVVQGSAK